MRTESTTFRLRNIDTMYFTPKNIVDLFLERNNSWFTDKNNLYGWKVKVRRVLLEFVLSGEDLARNKETIYCLTKFQNEWLPRFRRD